MEMVGAIVTPIYEIPTDCLHCQYRQEDGYCTNVITETEIGAYVMDYSCIRHPSCSIMSTQEIRKKFEEEEKNILNIEPLDIESLENIILEHFYNNNDIEMETYFLLEDLEERNKIPKRKYNCAQVEVACLSLCKKHLLKRNSYAKCLVCGSLDIPLYKNINGVACDYCGEEYFATALSENNHTFSLRHNNDYQIIICPNCGSRDSFRALIKTSLDYSLDKFGGLCDIIEKTNYIVTNKEYHCIECGETYPENIFLKKILGR